MKKRKLTSLEWLVLGLSIFYCLIAFLVALGMDASHTAMNKNNLFEGLAELFGMPLLPSYAGIWILLIFVLVFLLVFVVLVIVLRRFFMRRNEKTYSFKAICFYILAFTLCFAFGIGFGILFQLGDQGVTLLVNDVETKFGGIENLDDTFGFVFGALLLALLIYIVLGAFVWGVIGVINYCLKRKPAPIKSDEEDIEEKEKTSEKEEEKKQDLASSFSDVDKLNGSAIGAPIVAGQGVSDSSIFTKELAKKEEVFKNLVAIDNENLGLGNYKEDTETSLKDILHNLQGYLATKEHLYYELNELAEFIAGLSASKFIILEGVSGTGKSSLPRYFGKFIGEEAYFEAIQVTYKEKSDLLGFYNELTGKYNETPFLENLYRASYEVNRINLVVLDEMNISRVEYYFADFLSVMEFPESERRISLTLLPDDYDAPDNLEKGELILTPNTYFIGTANKDDSTFTITDKVIDRAIVIDFENTQKEISFENEFESMNLGYEKLNSLFKEAKEKYKFKKENKDKFLNLISFMSTELDIVVGNRILKQVDEMVPVFISMGLKEEECLDFIFANKILRKLEARYDSSLRSALLKLNKLLDELYTKNSFLKSRKIINKYLRRAI